MSGVYFAYDGSIHGDWVSHYAARQAARHVATTLQLVCVRERPSADIAFQQKVDRIRDECGRLGVNLTLQRQPLAGSVSQTIRSMVPAGGDSYLICGTRSRERKRGLLSGTVSESLLRSNHCHVLAVRVLEPGLLGLPRQILVPVSGHPKGFRSALPFLRLFGGDISHLHILYVQQVSRWRFRMLSHQKVEELRRPGQEFCRRVEEEIRDQLDGKTAAVESHVVVSDDVPKEIVISANKTKSRLIYIGASERNLAESIFFGNPIEQVLRDATCDVAVYRGLE